MNEYAHPTPDEARRTLAEAEGLTVATVSDRERLERGLIGIAVAVGLLIPALRLTVGNPEAPTWFRAGGMVVAMALYLVAIMVAVITMRRASASPRGFTLRYNLGLAATMLIYAAYVALQSVRGDAAIGWTWTILAAVAAVTPALLAARSISKLDAR
ncbi:hypothetical protein [Tsukamurella sp. 1534]|uniref:hypothetical protein n=1 Tax=Tsukamurella sp. 1534 TaxID=1151061 RepID=UPI00030CBAF7|nr:hypothetical protein [Tsukamurella sp. 1534]